MKKRVCLYLVILICFLFTSCGVGNPTKTEQEEKTEEMLEANEKIEESAISEDTPSTEALTQSVIQVQTNSQLGSGVLWEKREKEWIVVTAAHVVEGLAEAEVYLVPEDKFLNAQVFLVNGLDLAFLTVSTSALEKSVEANYKAVIKSDSIEEGDVLLTVGYNPYGELCKFPGTLLDDWMYVEDFGNYMLLCDCQAEAGMSGGAVVTMDGRMAGLICGENEQGMLAALPIGVMKSEYELFRKD